MIESKRSLTLDVFCACFLLFVAIPFSMAFSTSCSIIDDELIQDGSTPSNRYVQADSFRFYWALWGEQSVKGYVYLDNNYLSSQGMAIYGGRMYNFFHNGYCMVHRLAEYDFDIVSEFKMDVYDRDFHLGVVSIDHSRSEGTYLYATASNGKNQCFVFRIEDNSIELVQTITIQHDRMQNCSYQYCVGDGFLWEREIYGDANNLSGDGMVVLRNYGIPDISQDSITISSFQEEYIIPGVYSAEMSTIQGFKIYDGIMYALFGDSISRRCLQIVDVKNKEVIITIPLDYLTVEPEDCDVYNGTCYIVQHPNHGVLALSLNINEE